MNLVLKNFLTSILFILIFSLQSQAQINIEPSWENLQNQQYEVVRIKHYTKNDNVVINDTSQYIGEWQFLEKKEYKYILQWTMKDSFLESEKMNQHVNNDLSVIYSVSETGEFLDIENWRDIKKYFRTILKEVKKTSTSRFGYKLVKAFYKDKDFLESIVAKEINALHEMYSYSFQHESDTIRFEEDAYNLLSDDPIITNTSVYVDSIDKENNKIIYRREKKYDPKSANEVAIQTLRTFSMEEDEEEINKLSKNAVIDIQKRAVFEYDYLANYPVNIELEEKNIVNLGIKNTVKVKKRIITQIR